MKPHRLGLVSLVALAGLVAVPATAQAGGGTPLPYGATCVISGKASFSPYLKAVPQTVSYSFTATLSHCVGRSSTGVIDKNVSGSASASGKGVLSCEGGESSGSGSASVGGNIYISFKFLTESAGADVVVESPPGTSGLVGDLAFSTTTPQLCATTGLPTAAFNGWGAAGTA